MDGRERMLLITAHRLDLPLRMRRQVCFMERSAAAPRTGSVAVQVRSV
jgi:hypothetical protein